MEENTEGAESAINNKDNLESPPKIIDNICEDFQEDQENEDKVKELQVTRKLENEFHLPKYDQSNIAVDN